MHHFKGTKGRWYRLQQFGASDDALKEAISDEIGIFAGSTRPGGIDIISPPKPVQLSLFEGFCVFSLLGNKSRKLGVSLFPNTLGQAG